MRTLSPLMLAAAAALMFASPVFAQAPAAVPSAPPAPAATPAAKPAKAKTERTAASLDCSKQADAKNLHGKDRRKFRSECKKTAGKAN